LPSDQCTAASGGCQHRAATRGNFQRLHLGRQHLKGQGQQRVTRQNGQCLAKYFVIRGTSTPQVVVVHGWQIVMDQ
jgi:hypothetical protein